MSKRRGGAPFQYTHCAFCKTEHYHRTDSPPSECVQCKRSFKLKPPPEAEAAEQAVRAQAGPFSQKEVPTLREEPDEVWVTQDGRVIKVGDLEVDHMRNILRMIIKRARLKRAKARLRAELERQLELLSHEDPNGRDRAGTWQGPDLGNLVPTADGDDWHWQEETALKMQGGNS